MAYIGQSPKFKRGRFTPQSAAPSNPTEGDVFYSDGTALAEGMYVYKNGSWQEIGSAAGGINYIENNSAESGTTDWSTYDDGASSVPVDGTAGSPTTLTFTANTSSPLRGTADFDLAKSAADGQGEGVSVDFTIDNADKSTPMQISFDYVSSSAYADDDIGIFIYDVTNAQLIRFNGEELKASTQGHYNGFFQTSGDSTSYRLIFHVKSTNASAYSLNFDNVRVGPSGVSSAASLGREVFANVAITGGVSEASSTSSNKINGTYTVRNDNASVFDSANDRLVIPETGIYEINAAIGWASNSTGSRGLGVYDFTNSQFLVFESMAAATAGPSYISLTKTLELEAGTELELWGFQNSGGALSTVTTFDSTFMTVSKVGKALSTIPSGRSIIVEGISNGGASLTANVTNITWTETRDSVGAWDGQIFTAPETGFYNMQGLFRTTSGTFTGSISSYIDGSAEFTVGRGRSDQVVHLQWAGYLTKGQQLSFRANQNITESASTAQHWIRIWKSNENTDIVLPQDKVQVRLDAGPGQSITGSDANIQFSTVLEDTHSAWSTGSHNFTAPKTTDYAICLNSGGGSVGRHIIKVKVDGTDLHTYYSYVAATNNGFSVPTWIVPLVKGEVLSITIQGPGGSVFSGSTFNTLTIRSVD